MAEAFLPPEKFLTVKSKLSGPEDKILILGFDLQPDLNMLDSTAAVVDEAKVVPTEFYVKYAKSSSMERIRTSVFELATISFRLLFWQGDQCISATRRQGSKFKANRRVTDTERLNSFLHARINLPPLVSTGNYLIQEMVATSFAHLEQQRLNYILTNPTQFPDGRLPNSVLGSPRYLRALYGDTLALFGSYGRPTFFITMTGRTNGLHYLKSLKTDIHKACIDMVRSLYRDFNTMLFYIKNRELFGKCIAYTTRIEFQKGGRPHVHCLFWIKDYDFSQVDRHVCAELPDPTDDPVLYNLIKKHYLHDHGLHCLRIRHGRRLCRHRFPRPFSETTVVSNDNLILLRRPLHQKLCLRDTEYDNDSVVSYSPVLTKLFECHISVEPLTSPDVVRYLFKYVSKNDEYSVVSRETPVNETKSYLAGRHIPAEMAVLRLFEYPLKKMYPPVARLLFHLPNEPHTVAMDEDELTEEYITDKKSPLLEFFKMNEKNDLRFTYLEFGKLYYWSVGGWKKRQRQGKKVIVRLPTLPPSRKEIYYLGILLRPVPGPKSFDDLKGQCGTFEGKCVELGLLPSLEDSWALFFQKISCYATPGRLRRHYAYYLKNCDPFATSTPVQIFLQLFSSMSFDLKIQLIDDFAFNESDIPQFLHTATLLRIMKCGSLSLTELTELKLDQFYCVNAASILNHRGFIRYRNDMDLENAYDNTQLKPLTSEQQAMLDSCLNYCQNPSNRTPIYLNGVAGSPKSLVLQTLCNRLTSISKVPMVVASTGIAALNYKYARTAHSAFSIPIEISPSSFDDSYKENASFQSLSLSKTILIWDEVSMSPKLVLEYVDKSLRF